jgi:hypothetical protein
MASHRDTPQEDRPGKSPPRRDVPTVGSTIAAAANRIVRPPFLWLTAVTLFVSLVSSSIARSASDFSLIATIVVFVVAAYLNIAIILASAYGEPDASPDHWVKEAWKRRTFWRFLLSDMFTILLVLAAMLLLVVPGFIVGGMLALAPVAAVLELHQPGDALRRSIELTKPARLVTAVVFGALILAPNALIQLWYFFDNDSPLLTVFELVGVVLYVLATIALVGIFLALGGTRETLQGGSKQEHFDS